jgi:hypothetical protein
VHGPYNETRGRNNSPHSALTASRFFYLPQFTFVFVCDIFNLLSLAMRSFTPLLVLVGSVLALPVDRRANVIPATCDPAVVKTVLDTVTKLNAPESVVLATFETA